MIQNKNKVFLGGTCANTSWREEIIKVLKIAYFNPVVENWSSEFHAIEMDEKENLCNIHFYLITKEMEGVFSIAEAIDSAHNRGKRTILHIVPEGFNTFQLKSLSAVVDLVNLRGGIAYIDNDISRSARVLNDCFAD
jgi:hypothetical protein